MKTLLCLFCFAALHVDAQDEIRTAGLGNGRLWLSLDEAQRLVYLSGYHDQVVVFSHILIYPSGHADETRCKQRPAICLSEEDWFPKHLRADEISKAVTMFYDDPLNLRLPIRFALLITSIKANGANAAEVSDWLALFRSEIAKSPD